MKAMTDGLGREEVRRILPRPESDALTFELGNGKVPVPAKPTRNLVAPYVQQPSHLEEWNRETPYQVGSPGRRRPLGRLDTPGAGPDRGYHGGRRTDRAGHAPLRSHAESRASHRHHRPPPHRIPRRPRGQRLDHAALQGLRARCPPRVLGVRRDVVAGTDVDADDLPPPP